MGNTKSSSFFACARGSSKSEVRQKIQQKALTDGADGADGKEIAALSQQETTQEVNNQDCARGSSKSEVRQKIQQKALTDGADGADGKEIAALSQQETTQEVNNQDCARGSSKSEVGQKTEHPALTDGERVSQQETAQDMLELVGTEQREHMELESLQESEESVVFLHNIPLMNLDMLTNIRLLRNNLSDIIDIDFGLLGILCTTGVLTMPQMEVIRHLPNPSERVDQLLDRITRLQLERFFNALEHTNQSHVINYIHCSGDQNKTSVSDWPLFYSNQFEDIRRNYDVLIDLIDSKHGLLSGLLERTCMSSRHMERILACPTNSDSNIALLDILRRKSIRDYHKFIHCLRETDQHRVLSLLAPYMGERSQFTHQQFIQRIDVNHKVLVELIDTKHGLVHEMYSTKCITKQHKEDIESAATQTMSNERLLDIVKRLSGSYFDIFIDCLNKTGQHLVSDILLKDRVVAQIDAKTNGDALTEECIVQMFKTLSKEGQRNLVDILNQQVEVGDITIVTMDTGHSIRIFFSCNGNGIIHLHKLYVDQILKNIVENILAILFGKEPSVRVDELMWGLANHTNCQMFPHDLTSMPSHSMMYHLNKEEHVIPSTSSMSLDSLPFEVLEMILIRAAGYLFAALNRITPRAEVYTIATISAVSFLWKETLAYRKYNSRLLKCHFERLCRPFKRGPFRSESLRPDYYNVTGMAESNGKLYVTGLQHALYESMTIKAYSSTAPFSQLADIDASTLGRHDDLRYYIGDIVASNVSSLLYIAVSARIWRLSSLSHKQQLELFTSGLPISRPWRLSANNGHLLVTPHRGARRESLFLYDECGDLLKSIHLPRYMDPLHAVESRRSTYVVSHFNRFTSDTRPCSNNVTEVDGRGRVVHSFDSRHQIIGKPTQLYWPRYVVLDDDGHVIVADRVNERVVLLEKDLRLERVLVTSPGDQPSVMCLTKSRQLFVSYYDSNKIDIFSI